MIREIDEHRHYLSDTARMSAYISAISSVVSPGDIVLDLGSGTGILGLLSCHAGASRVYSIEQTSFIQVARALAADNGLAERMTFLKGHSTDIVLPEKVDVVICDQLGFFGVGAGLPEYYCDARERFLRPGGKIIPTTIELLIAPVEIEEPDEESDFRFHDCAGFDFSRLGEIAASLPRPINIRPDQLLGKPAAIASIDLREVSDGYLNSSVELEITRMGIFCGIGGWFRSSLCEHVSISNSPLDCTPIRRAGLYLPIDRSLGVKTGDRVLCRLAMRTDCNYMSWEVNLTDVAGTATNEPFRSRAFHPSISVEDLRLADRDSTPGLTEYGFAVRTVLDLCNRNCSIAQIEKETVLRFPALFPTQKRASRFVANTLRNVTL